MHCCARRVHADRSPARPSGCSSHVLGQVAQLAVFAWRRCARCRDAPAAFRGLVARRVAGEPVAYLIGQRGFWQFDLQVTPATLIPRPETELLVELALDRMPGDRPLRVADLGTGSGAIALALAYERPHARGRRHRCQRRRARRRARQRRGAEAGARSSSAPATGSTPLAGERFDLIASNPPYIADDDVAPGRRATCATSRAARWPPAPTASMRSA